eukprot:1137391-Pelagomonas_calceolata.AAC.2
MLCACAGHPALPWSRCLALATLCRSVTPQSLTCVRVACMHMLCGLVMMEDAHEAHATDGGGRAQGPCRGKALLSGQFGCPACALTSHWAFPVDMNHQDEGKDHSNEHYDALLGALASDWAFF